MEAMAADPYQIALRLLSYRWRSEDELRDRLEKRDVPPPEIETTIHRLTEEGWIDDARFAREFVRSRSRRHGRRRIGNDLRRFGIGPAEATSALEDELDQDVEDEVLREAALRKIATLSRRYGNDYPASEVGRSKLARFLLNRGYPAVAVRKAVFELTRAPGLAEGAERENDENI